MEIFVLIRIPSLEKTNTQSQNFLETAFSVFLISPHTSSFMPQGLRYVLFLIYIVGNRERLTWDQWALHCCWIMLIFYLFDPFSSWFLRSALLPLTSLMCRFLAQPDSALLTCPPEAASWLELQWSIRWTPCTSGGNRLLALKSFDSIFCLNPLLMSSSIRLLIKSN